MAINRCLSFESHDDDAASTVAPSRCSSLVESDTESVMSVFLESPRGSSQSSTCPLVDTTSCLPNHSVVPAYPVAVFQPVFVPCTWAIAMPGYSNAIPAATQVESHSQTSSEACPTQQRAAGDTRWCAKKQRAFPVHSIPVASDQEWQARASKRQAAIELVKKTAEYKLCLASGCQPPVAPDAHDRSISKRNWEVEVMKFRDAVKAQAKALESPVANAMLTRQDSRPRWADVYDDEDEH